LKRILFVDDEPLVLQALQRMLRGMRQEWEMDFANGGAEALRIMAATPADVVISDMRMPEMNGAELLNEIMRRHPQTIRFILSGYADTEMILQCVGGTHQFLSKPCDSETLRSTIQRALNMDVWINNDRLKSIVSRLTSIPSLPALYFKILRVLQDPNASVEDVGNTIAQDPAMTAKMLQLVNSAFFGLRRQLSDPTEAVMQMGMETVKSLVIALHVFSGSAPSAGGEVERLYRHSLATAKTAKRISQLERQERRIVDESFTAGLLHDVGRLVLINNLSEQYAAAVARSRAAALPLIDVEREVFGATHAEVGGYLLGLWGLPVSLAEAAVFHHAPHESGNRAVSSLTSVHVANVFERGGSTTSSALQPQLDRDYLVAMGVWERVPSWRKTFEIA
jgi:HD-like signal output (HDOD) protein/CheY-like chemotaxis protein